MNDMARLACFSYSFGNAIGETACVVYGQVAALRA
jgi:hypothetical protein